MNRNDKNKLMEGLQDLESREVLHEMTDGLEEWCTQRKERGRRIRGTALLLLLLLTTTAIALTGLPRWFFPHPSDTDSVAITNVEGPVRMPTPPSTIVSDDNVVAVHEPVDYYYTGVAADGYSVAYGHDSRTLTYTRYSGRHLIHSVIHDTDDPFSVADSVVESEEAAGTDSVVNDVLAVKSLVPCDFHIVDMRGDAFYFTVVDSVQHLVSVRADVSEWMGQRILYNDTLVLPDVTVIDDVTYTVVALADSAFAGHSELRAVVLPSTLTTIGDMAFANCTGLSSLTVPVTEPPLAFPASFDRTDAGLSLVVPCGTSEAYQNDVEWVYFHNVAEDCQRFSDPRSAKIRVVRRP